MSSNHKWLAAVLIVLGLWSLLSFIRYQQQPQLSFRPLLPEDRYVFDSQGSVQVNKFQINKRLPAGTTVRLWVEAYEHGKRVTDLLSCEVKLSSARTGLTLYSQRRVDGMSLSIPGFQGATAHEQLPAERLGQNKSLGGYGVGGDLYDGTMMLGVYTYGLSKSWQGNDSRIPRLHSDLAVQQQLIADAEYVYLLKVQAILPRK